MWIYREFMQLPCEFFFRGYCRSEETLDVDGLRRGRSESSTGADENSTHISASYIDKHYPEYRNVSKKFSSNQQKFVI